MVMNKGVVMACNIFPPQIGGPALHAEKISYFLKENGFEIAAVTFGDPEKIKSHNFPILAISNKKNPVSRFVTYFLKLYSLAKNCDLIYAHAVWPAGLITMMVAKMLRKKYILRLGGDLIWERWALKQPSEKILSMREFYKKGLFRGDWRYSFTKKVINNAQAVVLSTHLLQEIYSSYYKTQTEKLVIVPNPIPQSATTEAPLQSQLLFMGRLVSYKNLETAIKAFAKISAAHADWQLLIVGEGPEKNALQELSKELNLGNRVIFHEAVGRENVTNFIAAAKIGLSPSLTDFNPNFILEFLAYRKPVLISSENGLSVQLPKDFIFNPRSSDELAAKIEYLIKNYEEARNITKEIDLSYSWDEVLAQHLSLIKKLT